MSHSGVVTLSTTKSEIYTYHLHAAFLKHVLLYSSALHRKASTKLLFAGLSIYVFEMWSNTALLFAYFNEFVENVTIKRRFFT